MEGKEREHGVREGRGERALPGVPGRRTSWARGAMEVARREALRGAPFITRSGRLPSQPNAIQNQKQPIQITKQAAHMRKKIC